MCIHLLSTVDSDYLIPFRVLVHSVVMNKLPATRVRWHMCETGLSASDKAEVETTSADSNIEFVWYELAAEVTRTLPIRRGTTAKLFERLFMPEHLLDQAERVIYLDADLLILDRIEALWSSDLNGAILGAVQDLAVPFVSSPMGLRRFDDLGFSREAPYFNAGVFLVDIAAWVGNQITRRAVEYLERYNDDINLLDQDALNAVLEGRWEPLDFRWNLTASLAARAHYHPEGIDVPCLELAIEDPGIIHFSGYLKPWIHPRLGSRWAARYVAMLLEVYPDHQLEQTLKGRTVSFYDRHLRTRLYPLETAIWQRMRGF